MVLRPNVCQTSTVARTCNGRSFTKGTKMAHINMDLPVVQRIVDIVSIILFNKVTILGAETGAGKTTIVPYALWNKEVGNVVVTGPRRLGVQMCADYVKELAGLDDDDSRIAYQHKIENCRTPDTELSYVTEGILLQELREDPTLSKYKVIIVDEVHERSTNVDLLLAFLRLAVRDREDLHVVIMSATLDIDSYAQYFGTSATISIPGRQFPVTLSYEEQAFRYDAELYRVMAERIYDTAQSDEDGDILVFLPDEVAIQKVKAHLKKLGYVGYQVYVLISSQSKDDRNAVLAPALVRKVILATNVAETSVTLEGVVFVIDSCRIKQDYYIDAYMGGLSVTMHSRAGLDQRKGRAGRLRSGYCHRMITKAEYDRLPEFTEPQILRVPKADVLLALFERGFTYTDVLRMKLITSPGHEQWEEARRLLIDFKYVTAEDVLTQRGKKILDLHIAPLFGLFIIAGEVCECLTEMLMFVAALQQQNSPFFNTRNKEGGDVVDANRRDFISDESDFITFYRCFVQYLACEDRHERNEFGRKYGVNVKAMEEIHRDWEDLIERMRGAGVEITSASHHDDPFDQLSFAILAALKHHLMVGDRRAFYTKERETEDIKQISIFPGSFVAPDGNNPIVVYAYERATSRVFAHWCHVISVELLEETALSYLTTQVIAERRDIVLERYLHNVLLRAHTYHSIDDDTPDEVRNQLYFVYAKSLYGIGGSSFVSRVNYLLTQFKHDEILRTQLLSGIASVFPDGEIEVICQEVAEGKLHGAVDAFCDSLRITLRDDHRFVEYERLVVVTREFIDNFGIFTSTSQLKEYCELDVVTLGEAERVADLLARGLEFARAKLPSLDNMDEYRHTIKLLNERGIARLSLLVARCPFCDDPLVFQDKSHAFECRQTTLHHPLMVGVEDCHSAINIVDFCYSDCDSICTSGVLHEDGVYRVFVPRQFISAEIEVRILKPLLCRDMARISQISQLITEYRRLISDQREMEQLRNSGCLQLTFGQDDRGIFALENPTIRMAPITKPEGFEFGTAYMCEVYNSSSYRGGILVRRCFPLCDHTQIDRVRSVFHDRYSEFTHLLM